MARKRKMWDLHDLVTGAEFAQACGVSRAAVCMWAQRYPDFPAPVIVVGNAPLYSKLQVTKWRADRRRYRRRKTASN